MAEEINKTYTSNSLYNDSTGVIAFAEQLKQELINWANYHHVTEELGPDNRPDTQNALNNLFLSVYERFLTFLNDADATEEAINTWKEIENFLADYTDEKTLAEIVAELNTNIESRLTVPLESTTGSSTTSTMTQKAITETINASKTFTTGEKVDNVGIDDEPTADSENLVKSGGVKYVDYTDKELIDSLARVTGLNTVNIVHGAISSVKQWNYMYSTGFYILLKEGDTVTLNPGTNSLYFAFLNEIDIPVLYKSANLCSWADSIITSSSSYTKNVESDCYLWVCTKYINEITTIRTPQNIIINGIIVFPRNILNEVSSNLQKEINDKAELDESIGSINSLLTPAVSTLNSFYQRYTFKSSSTSSYVLNSPISIKNEGDSFEFKLVSVNTSTSGTAFYSFSSKDNSGGIAIGLTSTKISVRAVDNTWICQYTGKNLIGTTIKIIIESGKINVYSNQSLLSSYNGIKEIKILKFGYNDTYNYWDGVIEKIKFNGQNYILSGTNTNVTVEQLGSFLSNNERKELDMASMPSVMLQKSASECDVYIKTNTSGVYIQYPLIYQQANYVEDAYPSFYDVWGVKLIKSCKIEDGIISNTHDLFKNGEAELAIRTERSGSETLVYVGGNTHGFENVISENGVRNVFMLVDGKRIAEDSVKNLTSVDTFEVYQKTNLYQAYSNTNPFAVVTKYWLFNKKGLSITTTVEFLRNITLSNSMFGMMCVYRRDLGNTSNSYLTSHALKIGSVMRDYNVQDGWVEADNPSSATYHDHNCNKIFEYGELPYSFVMEITDDTRKSNGSMYVATNASTYNKIYFDLTGSYVATAGEILKATQRWVIDYAE